jgi:hypothetical protein
MPLEPRQVLHVEPPRLSLQLFGREIPGNNSRHYQIPSRRYQFFAKCSLLIRPRVVIEDVKQRLNVQLREHSRWAEDRQRRLRIIRRCGVGVPWYVVLGLVRILGLGSARVTIFKQLVYLVQVRHAVHGFLLDPFERGDQI